MTTAPRAKRSIAELQQLWEKAVALNAGGLPIAEIARQTGLGRAAVAGAIKRSQTGDHHSLVPAKRGRKVGTGKALTSKDEEEIRRCLHQRPKHHGLTDHLWSVEKVSELIEKKLSLKLSTKCVGDYLLSWGVKIPKSERCEPAVKKWLDQNSGSVKAEADNLDAEIYWLKRPIPLDPDVWSTAVDHFVKDQNKYLVSAKNGQGRSFWRIVKGSVHFKQQRIFLASLYGQTKRRTLFIIRYDRKILGSPKLEPWLAAQHRFLKVYPDLKSTSSRKANV